MPQHIPPWVQQTKESDNTVKIVQTLERADELLRGYMEHRILASSLWDVTDSPAWVKVSRASVKGLIKRSLDAKREVIAIPIGGKIHWSVRKPK